MSEDFDKSDTQEGMDFHEAERRSMERFEEEYPEFIALFNRMVRGAIDQLEWSVSLNWWYHGNGNSLWPEPQPRFGEWFCDWPRNSWFSDSRGYTNRGVRLGPTVERATAYVRKLGYDVRVNGQNSAKAGHGWLQVNWSRRDGVKYP